MSYQYLQGMFAGISRHKYTHRTCAISNDAFYIQKGAISDFNRIFVY